MLTAVPAKAERIVVDYVKPVDAAHNPLFDLLKEHQALERVQKGRCGRRPVQSYERLGSYVIIIERQREKGR